MRDWAKIYHHQRPKTFLNSSSVMSCLIGEPMSAIILQKRDESVW